MRCQWAHLAIERLLARLRACHPHRVAPNRRILPEQAACTVGLLSATQLTRRVLFRRRRRRCFRCRSASLPSAVLAVAAVVLVTAFPSVFAAAFPATAFLVAVAVASASAADIAPRLSCRRRRCFRRCRTRSRCRRCFRRRRNRRRRTRRRRNLRRRRSLCRRLHPSCCRLQAWPGGGGGGERSWTGSWLTAPRAADFGPFPEAAAEGRPTRRGFCSLCRVLCCRLCLTFV